MLCDGEPLEPEAESGFAAGHAGVEALSLDGVVVQVFEEVDVGAEGVLGWAVEFVSGVLVAVGLEVLGHAVA